MKQNKPIVMPQTRQVWRDPRKRSLWRRLLAVHDPVIYEITDKPGYTYTTWIDGKPVDLFLPCGFRSDGASSPPLSWLFGFRPDGILCLPGYFHDFYYRNGFLLSPGYDRLFEDRGKAFADDLLSSITSEIAWVQSPGTIAKVSLAAFGWPAWWGGKKYRDKCAANPGYIELNGDFGAPN